MTSPFLPPEPASGSSGGGSPSFQPPFEPAASPFGSPLPTTGSPFGDAPAPVADPLGSPGGPVIADPFSSATGTTSTTGRPASVKAAAISLLIAGVLTLAMTAIAARAIFDLRDSVDNLMNLDPSGTATFIVSGYADDTETILVVVVAALGALMTVAYMLVVRSVWKGSNWPRNVSPFLAVMSLPAVFLGHVAILIVVAGVVAAVASWMPSARAYSAQRRA